MSAEIPGFVDLQINGYQGVSFSRKGLTREDCGSACNALLDEGTAAFLPTIVTSSIPVIQQNLALVSELILSPEFKGRLLGIHLEGPFISGQPGFVGAHNPEFVRDPDPSLLRQMQEWAQGTIRLFTLAAEIPGAAELAQCASELGMIVSIGHSNFNEDHLTKLVAAGAQVITHLGNGIANDLDRHHNPIWAGLASDDLTAMIITDGFHLPDSLIKIILRSKSVSRTVVTSDLSALAGLDPGKYESSGSQVVLEPTGKIHIPERNCLAGSGTITLRAMNHLASLGLLSEKEMWDVGFHNPLRLLGIKPDDLKANTRMLYDSNTSRFINA